MYFWNLEALKNQLKEGPLPEIDSFSYILAFFLLYSLPFFLFVQQFTIWDVYLEVVGFILTGFCVYYAFQCNGGKGGVRFLERYLSLAWVLGVRWTALIALPSIIIIYIFYELLVGVPETTSLLDIIVFSGLYIVYIFLLGEHISEVAGTAQS